MVKRLPESIFRAAKNEPILLSATAFHASAPHGMRCADCTGASIPCPDCYFEFWMIINPDRPLRPKHADNFVRPG